MTVTVCVPVWNGARFVADTLTCLRQQTLTDMRVLISVDASDDDSVAICQACASDARFAVTIQPVRLGWIGNVNWLLKQVNSPFGCIMPHDDLIPPDYLARLVTPLEHHPAAVLAYGDIETFGLTEERIVVPGVTGDRLDRIVTFLRHSDRSAGFRGVFRTSVLDQGRFLSAADGAGADMLWLLALAGEGELLRVPGVVYRKRVHATSVTGQARERAHLARGTTWLDHCATCYQAAMKMGDWSTAERVKITVAAVARVPNPLLRRLAAARQS